jgi:hypothetical protein
MDVFSFRVCFDAKTPAIHGNPASTSRVFEPIVFGLGTNSPSQPGVIFTFAQSL